MKQKKRLNKKEKESPNFILYSKSDNMVLLHRRDGNTQFSPNMWGFFGGAVEKTESVESAAVRELYEELRISISESELNQLEKNVYYIFFPRSRTRDLSLGEGAGFSWYTFDEALSLINITDTARDYLVKLRKVLEP